MQTTNHVLMVRPVRFAYNEETAGNNAFQQKCDSEDAALSIERQAVEEFDGYVALLQENGVTVDVLQDSPEPFTPDSIFPNNCISTHLETDEENGTMQRTLVVYPMFAENRRREREKLFAAIDRKHFDRVVDLTCYEDRGLFLEGTGSFVLDREHRMAYACISPRTSREVVARWADAMHYDYFLFDSVDKNGVPVYHTNVIMHVGTHFAVVCMESISDDSQRKQLRELLERNGKHIVDITFEQMNQFAGNMLELRNAEGEKLLVMSSTALNSLTPEQIRLLKTDVRIVAPDIHSIETAGGGSARCMLTEIF
ncbi:MAG: amidinotransferase [Prevotella sp.]|nr:amidinotransferase [Prevotella sp.]